MSDSSNDPLFQPTGTDWIDHAFTAALMDEMDEDDRKREAYYSIGHSGYNAPSTSYTRVKVKSKEEGNRLIEKEEEKLAKALAYLDKNGIKPPEYAMWGGSIFLVILGMIATILTSTLVYSAITEPGRHLEPGTLWYCLSVTLIFDTSMILAIRDEISKYHEALTKKRDLEKHYEQRIEERKAFWTAEHDKRVEQIKKEYGLE